MAINLERHQYAENMYWCNHVDNLPDLNGIELVIVGEQHFKELRFQEQLLELFRPKFFIHEMLKAERLPNLSVKRLILRHMKNGTYRPPEDAEWLWPWRDIIEMGLNFPTIGFYGCEFYPGFDGVTAEEFLRISNLDTHVEEFKVREKCFLSVLDLYYRQGRTVLVVGDTHLRTIKTKELGQISPIVKRFANQPGVVILRTPECEIQ